jgi:beta-galactosidase
MHGACLGELVADDEDNDGKGGWTDQGAAADMRRFATGERAFGGVHFNILPGPKSIVVLKSSNRKAGDLPDKVTIPVGRKVDDLFFLQAVAWCPESGKEAFRYVLHYKDG